MTDKVDLKKLDEYQAPRGSFRVLDVPARHYLALDGQGDPNTSPAFADAVGSLYPAAYALKFASKRELGRDYVVPPLEGLWWADDMDAFTVTRDRSRWRWTLMLMVPAWIEPATAHAALAQVVAEPRRPPLAEDVRVLALSEGLCVQTLHVGPFADEGPVLEEMHHRFIPERGFRMTGRHHEIYLSDARRTAPERRRTLLRQPVVNAEVRNHGPGSSATDARFPPSPDRAPEEEGETLCQP